MNRTVALLAVAIATPASADTLGGFSAVDKSYLVNADRVCTPVHVDAGAATGAPRCAATPADAIAKLDFKPPTVQTGARATFAATASGRTLTVSRKDTGDVVVAWQADDPIARVVEVYASPLEDRVAVAYTSRRGGHEFTDLVAFDLLRSGDAVAAATATGPAAPQDPSQAAVKPQVDSPEVAARVAAARKAAPAAALATWQKVLALDPDHSEAHYQIAAVQAAGKIPSDALTALEALAKSTRPDAIEWLIEARFDKAFARLLREPRFRAAVGLDRPAATVYERFMGLGGQWEQAGTACDSPTVKLVAVQDRSFKLRVKTTCSGQTMDLPFHGTWRIEGNNTIVLGFPPSKGKQATDVDESRCTLQPHADEDELHCTLGRDLDFTVLPTRR